MNSILLLLLFLFISTVTPDDVDVISSLSGGWNTPHNLTGLTGPCNIKKVDGTLSQKDFIKLYAYKEPVIILNASNQSKFRFSSTKSRLLSKFGNRYITVTSANTYSSPQAQMSISDYVNRYMKPQVRGKLGSETLYHFGDHGGETWKELLSLYQLAPYTVPKLKPAISFGLAGPGSGVPFHIHGATFAETIYGRKRWFLYSPDDKPSFDPDRSTLDWIHDTYPFLSNDMRPLECVLNPGEIIYFPHLWWHATLNVDTAVFVSTFLST